MEKDHQIICKGVGGEGWEVVQVVLYHRHGLQGTQQRDEKITKYLHQHCIAYNKRLRDDAQTSKYQRVERIFHVFVYNNMCYRRWEAFSEASSRLWDERDRRVYRGQIYIPARGTNQWPSLYESGTHCFHNGIPPNKGIVFLVLFF